MHIDLPNKQKVIYDLVKSGEDVPILTIFKAVTGDAVVHEDSRYQQSYLGSYITKLNRRLKQHGERVVPGRLKGTYRLNANVR
jgi:hypothetical protein